MGRAARVRVWLERACVWFCVLGRGSKELKETNEISEIGGVERIERIDRNGRIR